MARGAEETRAERSARSRENDHAATVQALRSEEAARASSFGRTVFVLAAVSILFVPFLPGVRWLKIAMIASIALTATTSAWVWIQAARPGKYGPLMFRVFGVVGVFSVLMTLYYSGVFSTGAVIVMLGIFFFGQGDDRRWAIGVTGAAIVVYVVLSVLITVDVIPEVGLMRGLAMPMSVRIFAIAMVPYIFGISLWQARLSRKATYDAVERLGAALRAVQAREALLQEANQNFDAMAVGGHGGYSGRRAGDYVLGDVLGRGGMGEVYAAIQDGTGERAAIKVLNPTALADEGLFQRFLREADILRCLDAPNLIALYGVGRMDGVPYLAMELLDGHDLAWHLRHAPKLALDEVLDLAAQVARGLEAAHAAGIVHRDLKPQNLFKTEASSTWKILDFGVAKLLGSEATLTRGAIIGTPGYMSPEQARGEDTDARADVFSFGAVLYRAITGRPPFAGADVPEAMFQVVFGMPARPSELVVGLPRDVDDVLAIAMAKKPAERFASASEVADALRVAASGKLRAELRVRASNIVGQHPWGHRAGARSDRPTAPIAPPP